MLFFFGKLFERTLDVLWSDFLNLLVSRALTTISCASKSQKLAADANLHLFPEFLKLTWKSFHVTNPYVLALLYVRDVIVHIMLREEVNGTL